MADPVSTAASTITLISLGKEILEGTVSVCRRLREEPKDAGRMIRYLDSLCNLMNRLIAIVKNRTTRYDNDMVDRIVNMLRESNTAIGKLQDECDKFLKSNFIGRMKTLARKPLVELEDRVLNCMSPVLLALQVLELEEQQTIITEVANIKSHIKLLRDDYTASKIQEWLQAPDAMIEHNNIRAKRQPGTGEWLTIHPTFTGWTAQENSMLWIYGFAGAGKSFLCSSAIDFVSRLREAQPDTGVGIFYFRFDDENKQDLSSLLRALIFQLSDQSSTGSAALRQLYASKNPESPTTKDLHALFRSLIESFPRVFIILDALDESPITKRYEILEEISTIRSWNLRHLHVLLTSRDFPDIRESLNPKDDENLRVSPKDIGQDIQCYVSNRLKGGEFRRWEKYHDIIQKELVRGAKGVFRWVQCQLDNLKLLRRSEANLQTWLESLPPDLAVTYTRVLQDIPRESAEDARRLFGLLCYSKKPLTVDEVIDALAVDLSAAYFNPNARLDDIESIIEICPAFIEISSTETKKDEQPEGRIVHFAHSSVQDYLQSITSGSVKQAPTIPAAQDLDPCIAHSKIVQICLIYLLQPAFVSSDLDQKSLRNFALARYAADWPYHYKKIGKEIPGLEELVWKFFDTEFCFKNSMRITIFGADTHNMPDPIHYACYVGLDSVFRRLLHTLEIKEKREAVKEYINKKCPGLHKTMLGLAAFEGHISIVQQLVELGANVDAPAGVNHSSALQAASESGHLEIVKLLLEKKANPNCARYGSYSDALWSAALYDRLEIVRILSEHGAMDRDALMSTFYEACFVRQRNYMNIRRYNASTRASMALGRWTWIKASLLSGGSEPKEMLAFKVLEIAWCHIEGRTWIEYLLEHEKESVLRALDRITGAGATFLAAGVNSPSLLHIVLERTNAEFINASWLNFTPLCFAWRRRCFDVTRILRDLGAHL